MSNRLVHHHLKLVGSLTTLLALASSCGTQINSLGNLGRVVTGASGVPPGVTSLTITDGTPTNHRPLALNWGAQVGSYDQYCLLENSTDVNLCIWKSGALPTSYLDSSSDGAFVLTAYLKNGYGTSGTVLSNTVALDHTPPALASASVTNSSPTSNANFSLTYGAVTGTYSRYCINENNSAVGGCSWTTGTLPATTFLTGGDGSKILTVWIQDAAGNISNPVDTSSVILDTTAPTLSIASPAAGSYINTSNVSAFTVSGACSENGRNVTITGSASATVLCTSGAWTANLDFTAASAGSVSIAVNHSDASGNAATTVNRSFTKDIVNPTVAITSPAASSLVNAASVSAFVVSGTCSENGRNVSISGAATATALCTAGAWSATLDVSSSADGTITVRADLTDAAGNNAVQSVRNFIKDVSAPTVAILLPAAGTYVNAANQAAFSVSGSCSENGQNVVITGAASATVACAGGAWSTNLDFTLASPGTVTITVNHSDAAGNPATPDSRNFTKDVALPLVAITAPAAGTYVNAANVASFTVSGTCSENGRPVVLSGAASGSVSCTAGAWSANLDFSAAGAGTVTITANHSDVAGNAATPDSRNFTKDVVLPLVAITSPAAASVINSVNMGSFAVSGTCSENTRTVTLSGDAVSTTATCTAGAWSANLDFTLASDGPVDVFADHTDAAGNSSIQATRSFTKSTGLPTLTIATPAAGAYVNIANVAAFAVTGTCSGNGENVVITGDASATVTCTAGAWNASLNFTGASSGPVSITVNHSDSGGNPANAQTRGFVKDVTAPTVAVSLPAAGSFIGSANVASYTVSGTCSENTKTVAITGDATANVTCTALAWTANLDFSAASPGTVTINVNHSDAAGNPATQDSRNFTKDVSAPTVAITAPAALSYINIANVAAYAVSGTCSENGRDVVISGSASATVTCTALAWSANLDFTAAGSGTVTITANHSDAAANAASPDSRNFVKDVTAPTVAISLPAANTYMNAATVASFTVSGSCSENTRSVTISGNASAVVTCTGGAWSANLDFSAASPGTVSISVAHTDAAGNPATAATRDFIKDVSAPTVAITSPAASSYVNNATKAAFNISGTCSENGRTVTISGAGTATPTCTAGAWNATIDVSASLDGNITVYADHTDLAGNSATQDSRVFIKDVAAPTVAITSPAAGAYVNNTNKASFTVSGTCSENTLSVVLSGAVSTSVTCTAGAWTANLDLSAVSDGTVTVNANHTDAAGNPATQDSRNFTKDTALPTVAISLPAASSIMNDSNWASFAVSGTCSENTKDVVITGAASATVACSTGTWAANLNFSAAANGTVTINVNHSDAAGNAATQASRSFEKVPLPGAFVISSTVPGHEKVTLTWGASSNAVSYTVKYGTVSGTWGSTFSTSATSPIDVTGLTDGTLYYFMVTAVNTGGTTNATAESSATPNLVLATTAGPASVATGICSSSAYTITSRDAGGTAYPVPSDLTVTLSSGGTGVNFYASTDTNCTGGTISSIVITSGTSTKSFYMKTNLAQALTVGGSAASYVTSALSVTSAWTPTRIDLVAGTTTGIGSTDDANGANARFNNPHGVALDSVNNVLYVADTWNCTVRKVDMANNNATTTIAGTTGACGIADGNGAAAQFQMMFGITYDGARYLYATDYANCAIRKIDTQSPYAVTTILGSAGCGVGEGTEAQTKLSRPHGIVYTTAASTSGTGPFLYVANNGKHTITRVDLGVATSNSGYGKLWLGPAAGTSGTTDATGTSARLNSPGGLAADATNLYIADMNNNAMVKVPFATAAKSTIAYPNKPTAIAVVGTNLYYQSSTFSQPGEIRRMTNAGASDTLIAGQTSATSSQYFAGDYDNATGTLAYFAFRNLGFSFAADASYVYVPDVYNNTVRKVAIANPYAVTTIAGMANKGANSTDSATGTSARFKNISSSTTDGTSLYITEKRDGSTVRKYDIATGAVTTLAGSSTTSGCTDGAAATARFTRLRSIAYRSGTLYAFDEGCGLRTIDTSTGAVATMTLSGTDAAIPGSYSMAVYGNYLYIGSFTNYRIWRIDVTAASPQAVVRVAGTGSNGDSTGAAGSTAIGRISSIYVNATDIYYYDWNNIRIKRIDYAGTNTISYFAGYGSSGVIAEGTGTSIALTSIYQFGSLAGDATNLYFLDCEGGVLRKINLSTGASSMMSGDSSVGYYGNWAEQRELDGVYSTSSGANMVQGTHHLTATPHGLFMSTVYGTRWVH